jgi:hypothetical protein
MIGRASRLTNLTLAVRINPGDTYEWSNVLLARAGADGLLELLTSAWERSLGYGRREFSGKTLRELMQPVEPGDTIAAILDPDNTLPVEVTLRCRNGTRKRLRLHRRFDEYGRKMFIVAEEAPS